MATTTATDNLPRVLHIDFPAAILKLLETAFARRGWHWDSAETGVAGLHMALVGDYHLILLALRENTIDGLRVLNGLRRAGVSSPVVVLMPGKELEMRKEELARYPNVLDCLAKPLDLRQVDKAMEFLRHPPSLKPKDKARLMEVLERVERAMDAAA